MLKFLSMITSMGLITGQKYWGRLTFTLIGLLWFTTGIFAQSDYPVRLISDPRDGEIRLRWAPTDNQTWELANRNGYRLERLDLQSEERQVLADDLRPLGIGQWDALLDTLPAALMYYGALYSEDLQITNATSEDEAEVIQANRYGLSLLAADQFFEVSLAAGLGYRDENVLPGRTYQYLLTINNYSPESTAKYSFLQARSDDRTVLPPPVPPRAVWENLKVTLEWDQSVTNRSYTTYQVERSANGGTFQKRNQTPLLYLETEDSKDPNLYFIDSLAANDMEYTYRIVGRSPFGIDGPPSETVTGTGVPLPLPYTPRIATMLQTPDDGILMTWFVPSAAEGKYYGFHIYRSLDGLGDWEQVTPRPLPANRRTYTDKNPKSGWLYQVRLIDENNYEVGGTPRLLVLEDKYPPAPPTGIVGKMDTNGIVRLHWTPNLEEDHQGYRVFISNQLNGTYVQDTYDAIIDTTYRDTVTMKTLTEKVYYKLKAIDYYGNYSKFSEPAMIVRPDLNPPSPPVIDDLQSNTEGVSITWTPSASKDVVSYTLQRRPNDQPLAIWEDVFTSTGDILSYQDEDLQLGRSYVYQILVTDDAGLSSISQPALGTRIDDGQRAEISDLNITTQADRAILTFACIYPVDPEYFQLYRSINGGPLKTLKTLQLDNPQLFRTGRQSFRFVDQQVKIGDEVKYQVLARYVDGGFTPLSTMVEATIE